jgi:hypothetical protein
LQPFRLSLAQVFTDPCSLLVLWLSGLQPLPHSKTPHARSRGKSLSALGFLIQALYWII